MKCDNCGAEMDREEAREHLGRVICEDCYMDVLSPVRTCDPWSTHSAKSFGDQPEGQAPLTGIQRKILDILEETKGCDKAVLLGKIKPELSPKELERELSTLHHMEKVGARREGDRVVWLLWPR